MSHLEDGQIHMLLDGALELLGAEEADRVRAHLESCADCRTRLEGEAGTRDRAHALLDEGGPGEVELPSLEELRREASLGAQEKRKEGGGWRLPRGVALAWAASLVLALGVGLYGPELWERSRGVESLGAPEPRVMEPAGPTEGGEPGPAAPGGSAAEEASPPEEGGVEGVDAPEKAEAASPPPPAPEVRQELPDEPGAFRPVAPDPDADIRRALDAAFQDRGDSVGLLSPGRRIGSGVEAPVSALGLPTSADDGRTEVRPVPGLDVLAVEDLPGGVTRIEQALPEGDTLVVFYLPAGSEAVASRVAESEGSTRPVARRAADREAQGGEVGVRPVALPPLPEGWSQAVVTRQYPGAVLYLRARRPVEVLRELGARIP